MNLPLASVRSSPQWTWAQARMGTPFSDLADSAGAGLLGLEPADLDGGGAVEEEEPRPRELFDEWPRPARRTRTRTTAPDDPQKEEVHESAQKLGKRSAEVRRQRRLAAPKLPPKPEPVRPPRGFDPARLPGQRRRR